MAHDLRSPLTSLRGKLELALGNSDPVDREANMVQCVDEIDRLSAFLVTSLDVSEANAGALRLRKERLDLNELLRSLTELYEPAFAQAGLSLRVQSGGPAFVAADAGLMQRTFANLLDNELRYLPSGCEVVILVERDSNVIRLIFQDDGDGFPTDPLPSIFDCYTKGPASSGFGLGLAFVSAVVRSNDGTVRASNREGGGASIDLNLMSTVAE